MKTIWKYTLEITGKQELHLPKGAEPLCVKMQKDIPCIWFLVDTKEETIKRTIYIYGTGQPLPDMSQATICAIGGNVYIDSFKSNNDVFIWHVFWNPYSV
jgi:hypothetical protein